MNHHWHNTTDESYEDRAISQEEKILTWFREHPHIEATPFNIQQWCMPTSPITSVRRAMSNLTRDGKLEKMDKKVIEVYGISNYLWRLKEPQLELF